MKLTRKELRYLIETFIAGPEGRLRKLTGNIFLSEEDDKHPLADYFMQKALDKIDDPKDKRMVATLYAGSVVNKHYAIDLAASLIPESDEEFDRDSAAEDAHFDLDTALNPVFKVPKRNAYYHNGFDTGLLKTYLFYLHRKKKLKGMSFSDIHDGFLKKYPDSAYGPSRFDLQSLGIDFNDDEEVTVKSVDPKKFKL